jgi:hypothetical protein
MRGEDPCGRPRRGSAIRCKRIRTPPGRPQGSSPLIRIHPRPYDDDGAAAQAARSHSKTLLANARKSAIELGIWEISLGYLSEW